MKYYLFRFFVAKLDTIDDCTMLPIDFLPPDCASATEGDKVLVYVSVSLKIIGVYEITNDHLRLITPIRANTLKDIWECFDFVKTVGDQTSRLFKRKMREISKEEFETVIKKIA